MFFIICCVLVNDMSTFGLFCAVKLRRLPEKGRKGIEGVIDEREENEL